MSYKHPEVHNAVKNVQSLYSFLIVTHDELARARERFSDAYYRSVEEQKRAEYRAKLATTMESIKTMKRNLTALLDEREPRELVEFSKNEGIQLLSSGAELTAHELALIMRQDPKNTLLLRSAQNYAKANGMEGNKEYEAALNTSLTAQNPPFPPRKCVDNLVEYLTNYSPADSAFNNPAVYEASMHSFNIMNSEGKHLFETFDNGI